MIDRIEELLEELAAEDEEEQEDVLAQKRGEAVSEGAWTVARASDGASGPRDQPEWSGERPSDLTALQRDDGAAKPQVANGRSVTTEKRGAVVSSGLRSERSESGEAPEGRTAFTEPESLDRAANRRSVTAGEIWKDTPVWTVRGGPPEMDEARGAAAAGRTAQAEEVPRQIRSGELIWSGLQWTAHGVTPGPAPESVGWSGPGQAGLEQAGLEQTGPEQAGLKGLYRQTVGGLRPAAPALPPEQAGRTARAQEPGSAASLAVDELDRAARRDSRRYDGGMSIY